MALVSGVTIGGIGEQAISRRFLEEVLSKCTIGLDSPPISVSELKELIDGINERDDFALIIHRDGNDYVSASAGKVEVNEPASGRLNVKVHGVLGNTAPAVDRLRKDTEYFISVNLFKTLIRNYHCPYTEFPVSDGPGSHSVLLIYPYTPTPLERGMAEQNR